LKNGCLQRNRKEPDAVMEFASQEETALAMVVTARWLPVLVRSFEKGVEDLGLAVTERSHFIDQDGKACPTLGVRGQRLMFRLGLRNALEDFLAVDREARPVRVDPRLVDETYAKAKVADVVARRLEILKILEESRDLAEAQARINELAGRFEWLRAVFVEDTGAEGPGDAAPLRKPVCMLVGTDGNVFSIIGRVKQALKKAGQGDRAREFVKKAFRAGSYDEVLRLCMEYVEMR
jgi:hypothetical protein